MLQRAQMFVWLCAFACVCFMNFEVSMPTHLEMQRALPYQSCGLQALVWEFGRATSKELTWAVFKPWPVDDCRGSIHESNMFLNWVWYTIHYMRTYTWDGMKIVSCKSWAFPSGPRIISLKAQCHLDIYIAALKSSLFKHSQTISDRVWYFFQRAKLLV